MTQPPGNRPRSALQSFLELAKRARRAESAAELQFMLVNETFNLAPYQLAVLWTEFDGILSQSGVSSVDRQSSFVLWLSGVIKKLSIVSEATVVLPEMLSEEQVAEWAEWLPAAALWVPVGLVNGGKTGVLICREDPWSIQEIALIDEWCGTWKSAWERLNAPTMRKSFLKKLTQTGYAIPSATGTGHFLRDTFTGLVFCLSRLLNPRYWFIGIGLFFKWLWSGGRWLVQQGPLGVLRQVWQLIKSLWTVKRRRYTLFVLLVVFFPVRLTVLAPAELVPENPAVIRVPIEGVVEEFFVKPNETVQQGQLLFRLDLTSLISKLQISQQEMQIAEAEYRQSSLQSLTDPKSRMGLTAQEGKAAEKKLETDYLKLLLEKAQIKAPRAGVAIFDDPSEWLGKPVVAGEKIMVVATESKAEIEVWIPLNEAIELSPKAKISMYLNTTPLSPVTGIVRYMGHDAIQRPDGSYAYRMRARIDAPNANARIGLRGTAKLSGQYVPFSYWMLRKPLIALRQFVGI